MKTCSLIVLLIILNSLQLKAQSQDLVNNTWYLEKVVISGDDIFVPNLGSQPIAYAEFNSDVLFTEYCNSLFANLQYSDNMNFSLSGQGLTFEGCFVEEYDTFDAIYFNDFFGFMEGFFQPFNYEITDESPTLKKLTITNTNEDQAVYYSETLSTPNNEGLGILKLYPNPAQNEFSVNTDMNIDQIKIYNLSGQIVLRFQRETSNPSYDISSLSNGIYFVELSSLEGKKTVRKLIKE